ncbi:hypothetical protein DFH09DRAFT_1123408 [Mycena vulgaris]|nr:hypothetical protein DFH09DRAFT_1123408 [Mycena vulgaris]
MSPVAALPLAGPDPFIRLDIPSGSGSDANQDQYRWAVVYENQRGLSLFSSLYYSPLSLLPTDPSPFTIPQAPSKRSKQPDVSLAAFPLPDGAWRWLSPWMIDMRSDSGEVQHDGFEYNWMFRTHKWHPESGPMSWVRRRRWIRLMMRPATQSAKKLDTAPSTGNRYSMASSVPPSVLESHVEDDSFFDLDVDEVWLSDDADANWERCRVAMRRAGTDGRILELWRRWFGDEPDMQDKKAKRKQWTEDDDPPPSDTLTAMPPAHAPSPRANILPALRRHGDAVLRSFIYPESRARFIQMLERVGVLGELNSGFGGRLSSSEVQFWSYVNEVGDEGIIPQDSTVKRV